MRVGHAHNEMQVHSSVGSLHHVKVYTQIDHQMINDPYQSTMRSVSRPTLDRETDRVLIVVLSSLYYYGLAIINTGDMNAWYIGVLRPRTLSLLDI